MELISPVPDGRRSALRARASAQLAEQRARANDAMLRYARGDDGAFPELYRLIRRRLYRFCHRLAGPYEADELLQEVFLKMHRGRAGYLDEGNMFSWAFAIAHRTHLDRLRYRVRRPESVVDPCELALQAQRELGVYERNVARSALRRELAQLPEGLRDAFVRVRVQGMSTTEVSAELGVSPAAIRQRVHRAREALKATLDVLDCA